MAELDEGQLNGSEIAIIGMAGRFPGARTVEQFWQNLCQGVESLTLLSDAELAASGVPPAEYQAANYVRVARLLDDEDLFDAAFFGYTPAEAAVMDPQQRVFLECARDALEHAGYAPELMPVPVGVFGGSKTDTYVLNFYANRRPLPSLDLVQVIVGNDLAGLTTHVSYKLNLTGPSYALHTHCSTSLVAIHLACQSLLLGECELALAGGVAIDVPQRKGYLHTPIDMFSPDGRCRTFDAAARGFIFGNGAGVVVLKRLEDALADGDSIYALIKGSATNNDGAGKSSYTAPGIDGQAGVVATALAHAEVAPDSISYIETHGTGTPLGDAIEVRSLLRVFGQHNGPDKPIALGSVKPNIGHLGAAAGVAGVIKTALALTHGLLPPSLNFEQPNPEIDFATSPFYVNTSLQPWPAGRLPRRAGISSFGFGSTNAHIILEEPPAAAPSDPAAPWQLLVLSARSEAALEQASADLGRHLRQHSDLNLADVAYTLQVGRTPFAHRRVAVCRDLADAAEVLAGGGAGRLLGAHRPAGDPTCVFMFPGVGDQYVGMTRELYRHEPVFRAALDHCAEQLIALLGVDLRETLYAGPPPASGADSTANGAGRQFDLRRMLRRATAEGPQPLQQPTIAQPTLFAVEYALARLWQSWGIQPQALIGYSLGEYVAACLAGVFTLEDGLRLVARRAQLIEALPPGAMLAVPLAEPDVLPLLSEQVALAVVGGPSLCVLSGPAAALAELEQRLLAQHVACQFLQTSHAIHSPMMAPAAAELAALLGRTPLRAPQIPYISNLTGTWIEPAQATDPAYWARHLCETVRIADGLDTLLRSPGRVYLEVGPGETLCALARRQSSATTVALASLLYSYDGANERANLLGTLGQLWLAGLAIDWPALYSRQRRRRVALPTYPFERQRYWIETETTGPAPADAAAKRPSIDDWCFLPSWRRTLPPVARPHQPGRWLLFSDGSDLAAGLVGRLCERGDTVVVVLAGRSFADGHGGYTIRPGQRADYSALQARLHARDFLPTHVIHMWALPPLERGQPEADQQLLDRSFYSLLFIGQIIAERHIDSAIKLVVLSSGAQRVGDSDPICPEKATLLGPCKVIPQELPNVRCCNVDISPPEGSPGATERLLAQLLAECDTPTDDQVIAYRGYDRWVQSYEPAPLPAPLHQPARPLRAAGVYLITGGLGGIALTLAGYLARAAQARLVLVSRTAFPAEEHWNAWLASHDAEDQTSVRIGQLRALQAAGSELLVVQADVCDVNQLRAAVAAACARFGTIHGVIHAAGVPGGGLVRLKEAGAAADVLAPKLRGIQALQTALGDLHLDLMVLCSSLVTALPAIGQIDYCAANAFLDAFAQHNSAAGIPTLAINWDTWQQVGFWDQRHGSMASAAGTAMGAIFQEDLSQGITPEEGVEVFARLLDHCQLPQALICTRSLPALIAKMRQMTLPQVLAALRHSAGASHPRPSLGTAYVAPRDAHERRLAAIWQQLLGIDKVGALDNFFDLGGHSLLMTQLRNRIFDELKVELPMRSLFEHARLADMTLLLHDNQTQPAEEEPIAEQLRLALPTERLTLLERYLRRRVGQALGCDPAQLDDSQAAAELRRDLIALVELMWAFKQDLNFNYYPPEIGAQPSISALARTMLAEIDRQANQARHASRRPLSTYPVRPARTAAAAPALAPPARKNPPTAFVHSCQRSGSTLLRVMLAGHPSIYCPPEINLLPFHDMRDWQTQTGYSRESRWPGQGLHAALSDQLQLPYEAGWQLIDQLVEQQTTTQAVYARLQAASSPRLFIDKTPSYWRDPAGLRRSELLFESPRYIFQVRHPYAVIESLLRMRFDRVLAPSLFAEPVDDPYIVAETIWALSTHTLLTFYRELDPARTRLIRYEDLVGAPVRVMSDLCQFLELPFDERMVHPYEQSGNRMLSGLGDPNFLQHSAIDPQLGLAWRAVHLPRPLDPSTRALAAELGYELPNEPSAQPAPALDLAALADDAQLRQALARLSDAEVAAQLSQLLAQEPD